MRPRKNGVRSYSAATVKSKTNKLAVTKASRSPLVGLPFFLTSSFDYQASATDLERCSESCWRFVSEMV